MASKVKIKNKRQFIGIFARFRTADEMRLPLNLKSLVKIYERPLCRSHLAASRRLLIKDIRYKDDDNKFQQEKYKKKTERYKTG